MNFSIFLLCLRYLLLNKIDYSIDYWVEQAFYIWTEKSEIVPKEEQMEIQL